MGDPLPRFLERLERRHLASLEFAQVRKGLQALSSLYVERRERLAEGRALDGAAKRAAFALFYGPLHLITVREVARGLGALRIAPRVLLDLGCGTLGAGAGWALALREAGHEVELLGLEKNGWAAGEARFTLSALGLRGRIARADLAHAPLPERCGAVLAAFTVNELAGAVRDGLLPRLLAAARAGAALLVVEPIARRSVPWWPEWAARVVAAGGREDEWRFPAALPERLLLLDKAAGLDHRELLARSLFIPAGRGSERGAPR